MLVTLLGRYGVQHSLQIRRTQKISMMKISIYMFQNLVHQP